MQTTMWSALRPCLAAVLANTLARSRAFVTLFSFSAATIPGTSRIVVSLAAAELLLAADPDRERWVTTGASMVVVDTLVHNWLHRTGCLRRLGAEHTYGPACYGPNGCAAIIEYAAHQIDARQFCPDGPAFFPRLLQKGIWRFCANRSLDICNGNRIDDGKGCDQATCPLFGDCERVPLRASS